MKGFTVFLLLPATLLIAYSANAQLRIDVRHRFSERTLVSIQLDEPVQAENPRLVGSILALTLGPFGMHRIYFGTDVKVPIFYTLTLGGGMGFLPFVDLLHILFVRDLSYYYSNPRVFMFVGRPKNK